MATVYRARDLKHGRDVAIKVLRPDLAALIGADRFLAEIQTTAKLQHPHILPLFDSGAVDGFLYYVMPCLEGGSLREVVDRTAPMPPAEVARLVAEVGAALDYAHRHGVIHRDIKPANILLHDGSALLADFGIARAVASSADDRMTETGQSVGTPSYMSPEQAGGEREIGPSSDIYSLGVLAYEMLSGTVPFTGPTAQAVIAQLFTETPAPLYIARPEIPRLVDTAVAKALAKVPEARFSSAGAFAAALQAGVDTTSARVVAPARSPAQRLRRGGLLIGAALLIAAAGWWWSRGHDRGAPASSTPRLLAVLPFTPVTSDSIKDIFGRGLAVEITDELHRLGIGVVGSSAATLAAHRFRSSEGVDIQAAGRAVGADAVLDGTILPDSGGGRVSVQLTDVRDQVVLWSETYKLGGDLFSMQDAVARKVAQALRVTLTPGQFAQVRRGRSEDPVAHELVVRAKGYGEQRTESGLDQAIALYSEALQRDSSYAEAWAGLAEAYNLQGVFSPVRPRDAFRLAAVATDRALALDDRSASAHRSRGFLAVFYTHDWETGRVEFQRALDLDSLAAGTWLFRGWYFGGMLRYDSMLATFRHARALDSLTPINAIRLADILAEREGQYSAARTELAGVLRRDPSNEIARASLAPVLAHLRDCPTALTTLPQQPDEGVGEMQFFVRTWGLCGQSAKLRTFLRDGEHRLRSGGTVNPVSLAIGSTYLGDREGMYRWLEYAVASGDWMIFYINIDPEFDSFREEPRFRALIQRAAMPSP